MVKFKSDLNNEIQKVLVKANTLCIDMKAIEESIHKIIYKSIENYVRKEIEIKGNSEVHIVKVPKCDYIVMCNYDDIARDVAHDIAYKIKNSEPIANIDIMVERLAVQVDFGLSSMSTGKMVCYRKKGITNSVKAVKEIINNYECIINLVKDIEKAIHIWNTTYYCDDEEGLNKINSMIRDKYRYVCGLENGIERTTYKLIIEDTIELLGYKDKINRWR